jgi:hypothetical protein
MIGIQIVWFAGLKPPWMAACGEAKSMAWKISVKQDWFSMGQIRVLWVWVTIKVRFFFPWTAVCSDFVAAEMG